MIEYLELHIHLLLLFLDVLHLLHVVLIVELLELFVLHEPILVTVDLLEQSKEVFSLQ